MNVATINKESHIADLYWKVLYPLSTEDKLHLAALLTNSVYEESIAVEKNLPKVKRRVKKVLTTCLQMTIWKLPWQENLSFFQWRGTRLE